MSYNLDISLVCIGYDISLRVGRLQLTKIDEFVNARPMNLLNLHGFLHEID